MASASEPPLQRNSASFPVKSSAKLRELFARYRRLRDAPDRPEAPEARQAAALKYYQFLVQTVMINPEFGVGAAGNGRGLLVYHEMGTGKTRLACALAMALWDSRQAIILAPKSLIAGFRETIVELVGLLNPGLKGAELAAAQTAALARFRFVSSNAGNVALQLARATSGVAGELPGFGAGGAAESPTASLEGRIVIVDEAHNFFRGVINSGDSTSNARQLYEMMFTAQDTRFLFLTGTPSAKDPFELVPCFNILAGYELLPTQYEVFYRQYVEVSPATGVERGEKRMRLKNRNYLANRLLGLVSHVSQSMPSHPPVGPEDESANTDYSVETFSLDGGQAYDTRKAWALMAELPVEDLPLDRFQHILAEPQWGDVRAADVLADPEAYPEHAARIAEADLAHPILLVAASDDSGGFSLADGAHRLARAVRDRLATIKVRWIPPPILEEARIAEGGRGDGGLGGIAPPRSDGGFPEVLPPVVRHVQMGPDQYRQYLLARDKEEAEGGGGLGGGAPRDQISKTPALALPGSERGGGQSYHQKTRQLENFAPEELYQEMALAAMPDEAFTRESCPKVVAAAEIAAESPGPVLIYSQFVNMGGLAVIARYLRTLGYAELRGDDEFPAEPGRRFAVFSGEVSAKHRAAIVDTVSNPKNRRGEYVKVFLVSKTGAEGVNLRNFRRAVIFEPYWDKSLEDQLFARIRRLGGLDDLPPEDRDVQLFLLIAVANRRVLEGIPAGAKKETATIDERFHARALARYDLNLDARALLREVSLECSLNGYGECRLCVPSDAPLFSPKDSGGDLRLPDPCNVLVEAEVAAREVALPAAPGGEPRRFFFEPDPSAPLGYTFFRYDRALRAHTPIPPSEPLYLELVEAVEKAG